MSESAMQVKLARYKLDGTVWEQYAAYMGSLARFDLGVSTRYLLIGNSFSRWR